MNPCTLRIYVHERPKAQRETSRRKIKLTFSNATQEGAKVGINKYDFV